MIKKHVDNEYFDTISTDDPLVLSILDEFVESDTDLRKDTIRRRGWHVLPSVEAEVIGYDQWLEEALRIRSVERLLIISTNRGTDGRPWWAGSIPATRVGLRVLNETIFSAITYFVIDPERQFCWLQAWSDAFLLAGDLDLITDIVDCTFKTALDLSLNNAEAFGEKISEPWGIEMCRDYEEFFPSGLSCDVPTLDTDSFRRWLTQAKLALPPILKSALETRNGVRVLSPQYLKQRDWLALPIATGFDEDWFHLRLRAEVLLYLAPDAESLATAIDQCGHQQIWLFRMDTSEVAESFLVETTRDGILGAINLSWDDDILITSPDSDFAALGSAGEFFLVAGPKSFIEMVAGGNIERYLDCYDVELSRLEERAPAVAAVLFDVLLEYFDLLVAKPTEGN